MLKIFLVYMITLYQKYMSPYMMGQCRFYPSCSEYMKHSILGNGCFQGIWQGIKRLAKCHPFHPGGMDKVKPKNIRRYYGTH